MIAVGVKGGDPKTYVVNCRHLQSSKRGHAGVRKIGRPDRIYGKYYEA